MSSNAKSKQLTSVGKTSKKSPGPLTSKKIIRNLNQQFDDYVLKQQQAEHSHELTQQNADQQNDQNQQQADNPNQVALKNSSSQSAFRKNSRKKYYPQNVNNSKSRVRNKQKVRISQQLQNQFTIPKSYVLAMQHLQDLVQNKNEQIHTLQIQLVQKQEIILQCQQKINDILVKYHQLMDMYALKQNQVIIIKQQMEELRLDKQTALKQAAKAIQPQFKRNPSQEAYTTFKQRSISMHGPIQAAKGVMNTPPFPLRVQSKQIGNIYNRQGSSRYIEQSSRSQYVVDKQKINKQNTNHRIQDMQRSAKYNQRQYDKEQYNIINKNLLDPSIPSSRAPLLSQKSTNRDFISYQRQILRNEKQLIALKYRMECLERKLISDPKQQSIKQKIRKLSAEIENKERIIGNLKKI